MSKNVLFKSQFSKSSSFEIQLFSLYSSSNNTNIIFYLYCKHISITCITHFPLFSYYISILIESYGWILIILKNYVVETGNIFNLCKIFNMFIIFFACVMFLALVFEKYSISGIPRSISYLSGMYSVQPKWFIYMKHICKTLK